MISLGVALVFTAIVFIALRNEITPDDYLIVLSVSFVLFFIIAIPTVRYFSKQYFVAKSAETAKKEASENESNKWDALLSGNSHKPNEDSDNT